MIAYMRKNMGYAMKTLEREDSEAGAGIKLSRMLKRRKLT
jgi:hypothetical protein